MTRATSVLLVLLTSVLLAACATTPPAPATQKSEAPRQSAPTTVPSEPVASPVTAPPAAAEPAPKVEPKQASKPSNKLHHPKLGSDERKAILDGLRPVIERELDQKVKFKVAELNVKGRHAFIQCGPLTPSEKPVDFAKTKYRSLIEQGVFDGGDAPIYALLRYGDGTWKVLTFVIGPTDVAYATWWREYDAPKAIFPYTE